MLYSVAQDLFKKKKIIYKEDAVPVRMGRKDEGKREKNNAFFQHKSLLALLPEGLHIPM